MKKLILSFLLCMVVMASSVLGQSQRDHYKKIDYIKVDANHLEQFMKLAQNDLKSAYGSMTESTDLESWNLYKVQYPGGQKSDYDFISVTTAESMDLFEEHFSSVTTLKFVPDNTEIDFTTTSSLVKSEIWKVENDTISNSSSTSSRYMTMDYMDVSPGKGLDYLMLEDEIAKPIHEQRIGNDRMVGWQVYSLVTPSGTEYGYNYATGNFFDKLEHIEYGFTNEIIEQTLGKNRNIPELFNTIYSTRDMVKVEVWKLVTHAK